MLNFALSYRGQRGDREQDNENRVTAAISSVSGIDQYPSRVGIDPGIALGTDPLAPVLPPVASPVPLDRGQGESTIQEQAEFSNCAILAEMSPAPPVSPVGNDKVSTHGETIAPSLPAPVIPSMVPQAPASECERLVGEYLETFKRVGDLSGPDLWAAIDRISALGHCITRLEPSFDWLAIWTREGAIPAGEPAATWDADTLERIAWLEGVDAAALRPFHLPTGRQIHHPAAYLSSLRRDVARGPGDRHAKQVRADLADVWRTLGDGTMAPERPWGGTANNPPDSRDWDEETARLIAWLAIAPVPSAPFRLDAHRMVTDPGVFAARLRRDLEDGPNTPRARNGALQQDLQHYREAMERDGGR